MEYINLLEGAQKCWKRINASNPITDATLLDVATVDILANDLFP